MKSFKKLTVLVCALVMVLAMAGIACAEDYTAYLGIQGDKYTFRNAWTEANYGLEGTSNPEGYDYKTSGLIGWAGENNSVATIFPATIEDAKITGNGTYKISITDIEWNADENLNLLFISTNVPYDNGTTNISNMKVLFDGTEVFTIDASEMESDSEYGLWTLEDPEQSAKTGYMGYMIVNIYNQEIPTFDYSLPTDVEVIFTVSGMANDAPEEDQYIEATPEPTPTTAPTEAPEPTETPADDKAEATPTTAPADDKADDDDGGNMGMIIGIIAAVVVVVVVVVVVAKKKK